MFTGLIREMAKVVSFANNFLTVQAEYKPKIGDSIAINGACLTVVKTSGNTFTVELSLESQKILAMDNYKGYVHIEPAMMMGDRFEGHVVQGHVDCLGTINEIRNSGKSYDIFVCIPNEYMRYVIPKGSITVDGVSLTVNEVSKTNFRLTVIPHTFENTLFKTYKKGSKINIETDMFARYIENLMNHKKSDDLTWDKVDNIMAWH